jgi:hypothetical protein
VSRKTFNPKDWENLIKMLHKTITDDKTRYELVQKYIKQVLVTRIDKKTKQLDV